MRGSTLFLLRICMALFLFGRVGMPVVFRILIMAKGTKEARGERARSAVAIITMIDL